MKNTDLAWLAGILDGEGCFYINRQRPHERNDLQTDSFRLFIKVTMGHLPTIERIQSIVKLGTIQNHAARSKTVNASYSWLVSAREAGRVITLVKPYLLTKLSEVTIAETFLAIDTHLAGGAGGNSVKPQLLIDQATVCYWRMRMAKSRWRFYHAKLSPEDRAELKRLRL